MVYLMRHPQSEANIQRINGPVDGKLTKRGEWQARKTAKRCSTLKLTTILTSLAYRCKYLANEVYKYHNVNIIELTGLRERDYGEFEGQQGYKVFDLGISSKPKDGESVIDVYNRAKVFYDTTTPDNQTLIISHGLFLKMLTAQLLGLDPQHALKALIA